MAPRINIPPLTRSLLIGLVALTLLNAAFEPSVTHPLVRTGTGAPYLTVVVGRSLIYPWTPVSAALVEENVFGLAVNGLALFYGGRYLERAWSSAELARFLLIVAALPNVLAFILYWLAYGISRNYEALTATISGGIAIQAAFLVAFKQLVPEHTVSVFRGVVRIRVKHFPALFLVLNTLAGVIVGTETATLLAWLGFFSAWTYLRFYRVSPAVMGTATSGESATVRGDASDTFALAHFFPDALQPPVAALADRVHALLVALRVCTPFSDADVDAGNELASARAEGGGLPSLMNPSGGGRSGGLGRSVSAGGRREEAERRRALALKALDQRLHAASGRSSKPQRPAPTAAAPAPATSSPGAGSAGRAAAPATAVSASPSGGGAQADSSPAPNPLGETTYEPDRADEEPPAVEGRA